MRRRSWLIVGIIGAIGALCLCGGLGVGIAAYRFLPRVLTQVPRGLTPSPALTPTRGQTPVPPTRTAAPAETPAPSPALASETPALAMLRLRKEIPAETFQMAVSPDGSLLAVSEPDRIRVLDPRTGQELARFSSDEAEYLAFSPDGQWIATAAGQTVTLLDASARVVGHRFSLADTEDVHGLTFSPQGTVLLVGTESRLTGYYVESGRPAFEFELYGPADMFAMDPDERLVFQITIGETDMEVWDAHTGEWWGSIEFDPISAFALSSDGRTMAVAENTLIEHPDYGQVLAPGRVALWQVEVNPDQQEVTLDLLVELDFPQEVEGTNLPVVLRQLAFSPDGRWVAGIADWTGEGDTRGRLYLWEAATGRRLAREVLPGRPMGIGFVEGGAGVAVLVGHVAPVSADHRIQIWAITP